MNLMTFLAIAEIGLGIFSAIQGGSGDDGGGGGIYGGGGGGGGGGGLGGLFDLLGINFGKDLVGIGGGNGDGSSSAAIGGGSSSNPGPGDPGYVGPNPAAGGFPAPAPAPAPTSLSSAAADVPLPLTSLSHPTNGNGGTNGGNGGTTDPPTTDGGTFQQLGALLQGAGSVIEQREDELNAIATSVNPGASPTFSGASGPARNVNLEAIIQAMSGGVFSPGRK